MPLSGLITWSTFNWRSSWGRSPVNRPNLMRSIKLSGATRRSLSRSAMPTRFVSGGTSLIAGNRLNGSSQSSSSSPHFNIVFTWRSAWLPAFGPLLLLVRLAHR